MRLIDADALDLDREVDMADDWNTAHEMANLIKYAPTIEAQPVVHGEWILCSERIPKQGEQIIGTFDNGNGRVIVMQEQFWMQLLESPYPLIAWMPLPEPYNIRMDGKKV